MADITRITFVVLSSILLLGTIYSVVHHTWLDTSDPLIALAHAPHPLHHTHYFAQKTNILNVYFIKKAWAWTSFALLSLVFTSPTVASANGNESQSETRSGTRLKRWAAATAVWLVFTTWFFGPALLARITRASGGECVLRLPSGDVHTVPATFCEFPTPLSPATHPNLFQHLATSDDIAAAVAGLGSWSATPRLMRGHDVSGHVFLLTLSLLVIGDAVAPVLSLPQRALVSARSPAHWYATLASCALMLVWLFALLTTSVYFHSPFEKLTGYLLGIAGYLFTRLPVFRDTTRRVNQQSKRK